MQNIHSFSAFVIHECVFDAVCLLPVCIPSNTGIRWQTDRGWKDRHRDLRAHKLVTCPRRGFVPRQISLFI